MTEYEWDVMNRLTRIVERPALTDPPTQIVAYTYDLYGRRVVKAIDTDGDSDADVTEQYIYDGDDIVLVLDDAGQLTHRYLHGPAIDQILADEQASWNGVAEDYDTDHLYWPLADHQGSVRDVAEYDTGNDETDIVNHLVYSAFGVVTSETDPTVNVQYGFTGRERDEESGLNYHRARYLDSALGQWLSEDPKGFDAGDANLRRAMGNDPINNVDPSGLAEHDHHIMVREFAEVFEDYLGASSQRGGFSIDHFAVMFEKSIAHRSVKGTGQSSVKAAKNQR